MQNKNIALVTGAAGFIGSHMCDLLLSRKFEVRAIDNLVTGNIKNVLHLQKNKKFKFYQIDILKIKTNHSIFKNVKYIFHFAGLGDIVPSIENPINYLNTNVMGTVNVLEGGRKNNIKKFIYAASSTCYGLAKTPTSEDHLISTEYPYAFSKYIGESTVMHWNKVYKLPVVSIRIFNAYGRRGRTTGTYGAVFGVFLKQKLSNKPLTVVGDGKQKRDFVNVKDVAKAFYLAATKKSKYKIYNLGAGNPQSVNTLVKLLKNDHINIPKRPGEPNSTHANINRIKKYLGWKPSIKFKDGVKEMIDNIDEWKLAPLWNKKKIKKATKNWFKYLK